MKDRTFFIGDLQSTRIVEAQMGNDAVLLERHSYQKGIRHNSNKDFYLLDFGIK